MKQCKQCNATNLILAKTDMVYNELYYRCNCPYNKDDDRHGYAVLIDSEHLLIREISIGYESILMYFYPKTTSIYMEEGPFLIKAPFHYKFETNVEYINKIVNKIKSNLIFL